MEYVKEKEGSGGVKGTTKVKEKDTEEIGDGLSIPLSGRHEQPLTQSHK